MKRLLLAVVALLVLAAAGAAWWFLDEDHGAADIAALSKQAGVALGPVSARAIPEDDLPPAGTRSLFDHVLAQNDGLPFPFEKLVGVVQRQAPENARPLAVMIPLGRSLLKASADFHKPRVVFAADYHADDTPAALGIAPRGQFFLGFTEAANEIEVISYNELAGRFEFQLVQNYCAGCVPRIVYARRAICQTCHQGGSPIFSVRPWQETNGQIEIASRIVEARGAEPYLAVAPEQPLSSPERIDELTDIGNFINATQRSWLDGCGAQGAECRRLMLRLALRFVDDPAAFDPQQADAQALRKLQASNWPAQGIPVPNNDLASRDPLSEKQSLRGRLRAMLSADEPRATAKNNEDLETFSRLPGLPAPLDPLTPRGPKKVLTAQDLDGVFGLAQFITDADRRLLLAAGGFTWTPVLDAVARMPDEAFAAQPFSRVKTLQALLSPGVIHDVRKDPPARVRPDYCCLDTREMSPPVAIGVPPLAVSKGSVLEPFERHCFACHRGNPAKRLNFMGAATESEVLESIKATDAIRDALDWDRYRGTDKAAKLMPPADSTQHAALEAELKQNPKLLEQMRSVVPGMFDF
ncbi:MAG: hypothetical protein K0Q76_1109 [Panacagrimonas sp.]|nr:hypothetical protein [Panacagrimonas sp.]MCC2656001.1 hypothetical protein [Panacagrimonas sp.]